MNPGHHTQGAERLGVLLGAGGIGKRSKLHAKVFTCGYLSAFPLRDAGSSEMREIPPSRDDRVTYAVVQNSQVVRGQGCGRRGEGEPGLVPVSQTGRTRWAPWWQRLGRGRAAQAPAWSEPGQAPPS